MALSNFIDITLTISKSAIRSYFAPFRKAATLPKHFRPLTHQHKILFLKPGKAIAIAIIGLVIVLVAREHILKQLSRNVPITIHDENLDQSRKGSTSTAPDVSRTPTTTEYQRNISPEIHMFGSVKEYSGTGQIQLKNFKDAAGGDLSQVQEGHTAALLIGEKEYKELGLKKGVTHDQMWQAVRRKPRRALELCNGETIIITHGMGNRTGDMASVNDIPVDFTGYQLMRIRAEATQIEIAGLGSPSGKVLFFLDSFSNESLRHGRLPTNPCNLSEGHYGVAVAVGETVIIPISRKLD